MLPSAISIFEEGFIYTHAYNKQILTLIQQNHHNLPDDFYKILNHTINAHQLWNDRINGQKDSVGVWEMRSISQLLEQNEVNLINSLKIIEAKNLDTLIKYVSVTGDRFANCLHDILFHIINHSTYHRGQLNMYLRQAGYEPVVSDYIFYKRVPLT